MECHRDIWGGRKQLDRVMAKNNSANKHFNTISYNLSGNLILAGGNSPYICIYDVNFGLMMKKFKLTNNRSLDGILQILNSGANKDDLDNNEKDYDSQDSEWEKEETGITIGKSVKEKKKFNLPIKISKVIFSGTNRNFYIACSEGIFSYSLDSLSDLTINKELLIDENVSPQKAVIAFQNKNFSQAICYSIYLQSHELLEKFINNIDMKEADIIITKLPLSCCLMLCDFLAKKLETDGMIELNMTWVNSLMQSRYMELKNIKDKKSFLNLKKVVMKYYTGIVKMLEENENIIEFILDQ